MEVIVEVSWQRLMEKNLSKYISDFTAISKGPIFGNKSVPVKERRW